MFTSWQEQKIGLLRIVNNAANYHELKHDHDSRFFRFSDDDTIPFPDRYFDLVISDQVFEHVVEQEKAFRGTGEEITTQAKNNRGAVKGICWVMRQYAVIIFEVS